MSEGRTDLPGRLGDLRREILRWNRQINLVSRVDTRRRVDTLVRQCEDAWELLLGAQDVAADVPEAVSLDVGSGAGLPGLVWAAEREAAGHPGGGVLVEPRDKRAWFLARTVRRMGLQRTAVHRARWGEGPPPPMVPGMAADGARVLLVSLKALALSDREVLDGAARWDLAGAARRVVVVRFLDPGVGGRERAEDLLAVSGRAEPCDWRRAGAQVLAGEGLGLLVTSYHRT
jgi:hypothetical protein